MKRNSKQTKGWGFKFLAILSSIMMVINTVTPVVPVFAETPNEVIPAEDTTPEEEVTPAGDPAEDTVPADNDADKPATVETPAEKPAEDADTANNADKPATVETPKTAEDADKSADSKTITEQTDGNQGSDVKEDTPSGDTEKENNNTDQSLQNGENSETVETPKADADKPAENVNLEYMVNAKSAKGISLTNVASTGVASIGETGYATFEAAWDAAVDGDTITLLQDCEGNGMVAPEGKFVNGLTVDFNNHAYTISGTPVGSTNTETNGFQLLKGNNITFKNGKISGSSKTNNNLMRIIQNYYNLTLDNMEISLEGQYYDQTTISHCNGEFVIKDSKINAPDFSRISWVKKSSDVSGAALSVGTFSSYQEADATVTGQSTINGDIKVDMNNDKTVKLSLEGGTFNGELIITEDTRNTTTSGEITVTKTADFQQVAPEGFIWKKQDDGSYKLVRIANNVASIDGVLYETLSGAFAAADSEDTITLLTGITLTDTLIIDGKDIKLDLGGNTLTGASDKKAIFLKKGDLEISNGTIYSNNQAINVCTTNSGINQTNYTNLKIDSNANIIGSWAVILREAKYSQDSSVNCGGVGNEGYGAKLDIKGTLEGNLWIIGNIESGNSIIDFYGNLISNGAGIAENGAAIVNVYEGASIKAGEYSAIEQRAGTLNVYGGIFESTATSYSCEGTGNGVTTKGAGIAIAQHTTQLPMTTNISGGVFSGVYGISIKNPQGVAQPSPTVNITSGDFRGSTSGITLNDSGYNTKIEKFISGGTFSSSVAEEYCADGYIPNNNGDGTFGVKVGEYVAQIGTTKYETLSGAIAVVPTDGTETTIKLLKDTAEELMVIRDKNIILDLNNKTLTGRFDLYKGNLTIDSGTLIGIAHINGSSDNSLTAGNYNKLIIGSGAIIKGGNAGGEYSVILWETNGNKGYGSQIDIYGKLERSLWVMGNITNGNSVINMYGTIDSPDVGIAENGHVTLNIYEGAKIIAKDDAVEQRAGILNIFGGELESTATSYSCESNTSGTAGGGAALIIAQHTTKLQLVTNIEGGVFSGLNGLGICNPQNNTAPTPSISIESGNFIGSKYGVMLNDDVYTNKVQNFISGGTFSSPVNPDYCAYGFIPKGNEDGTYGVIPGYKVTFINEGSEYTGLYIETDGKIAAGLVSDPSKTGYTFTGWYDAETGGNKWVFGTTGTPVTASGTLYAIYEANTYTVHFNSGDATAGSMAEQDFVYDTAQNLTNNGFTKEGYHFVQWTGITLSGNTFTDGEFVKNLSTGEDITLYAEWAPNGYTIEYNANGGIGTENKGATYDVDVTLSDGTSFSKTGYHFTGWAITSDGTVVYTGGETVKNLTGTENVTVTLYAAWEADTYTVTYKANGGSGEDFTGQATFGGNYIISDNQQFTREGYTFSRWNTQTNGEGTDYATGNSITWNLTGNLTVYAQWKPITYTVTFNPGTSGYVSTPSKSVTYDDYYGELPVPTLTGYVFSGWYNGSELIESGNIVNITGAETFIAQWKVGSGDYIVYHIGEDLTGNYVENLETENLSGTTEETATAGEKSFKGYTYSGSHANNVTSGQIAGDGSLKLRLYYARNIHNVIYEYTGNVPASQTAPITSGYKYGATVTVETAPSLSGYSFAWSTGDASFTMPNNDVVITGTWTANTDTPYKVQHYQQNTGDNNYTLVTTDNLSGTTDQSTAAVTKDYTGFTLSGDITEYQTAIAGDESTVVKLYYNRNPHTLKFVVDGVEITGTVVYGADITAPADPTKDSCNSFAGWTSSVDGLTTTGTMPDSDVTFTANWNYTCSRSSGGGGGGGSSRNNTNNMQEVVLGGEVEVNTGDKAEINTGDENKLDESNDNNNGNGNTQGYDPELVEAYKWAYAKGITTMPTIEKARLKDGITRAELAKMMVVFMSEVLHRQPVITETFDYPDVNEKALGDLTGYIQLAYQYQIMGIQADGKPLNKFNPRGKVSRAEFATVLSRVLYGSVNNQKGANYREKHIEALNKAGILTNTDPKIQELRGWIILMLYRSQNSETNNVEENTAQVTTGDVAEVESGSAAEVATATGTTAEIDTGAVVEAATGATAQTAIAEANTGDVAKVESGSTAEVATGDSK